MTSRGQPRSLEIALFHRSCMTTSCQCSLLFLGYTLYPATSQYSHIVPHDAEVTPSVYQRNVRYHNWEHDDDDDDDDVIMALPASENV